MNRQRRRAQERRQRKAGGFAETELTWFKRSGFSGFCNFCGTAFSQGDDCPWGRTRGGRPAVACGGCAGALPNPSGLTTVFGSDEESGPDWERDDQEYFANRPHRRHRVRRVYPNETLAGLSPDFQVPEGQALFMLVKVLGPGLRMRSPIVLPDTDSFDVDEQPAARFWELFR